MLVAGRCALGLLFVALNLVTLAFVDGDAGRRSAGSAASWRSRRARSAGGGGAQLMPERPRYMISVAAELVGMHPQTLRLYEAKGLVRPARTPGGTRLYSDADVERLRLIQRLTTELGLNLAGVEHVLRLEDELAACERAWSGSSASSARRSPRSTARTGGRSSLPAGAATRRRGDDMDFQKLTLKSQEAVAGAQELARRMGNPELTPDHLTIALLDQELPRTLVDRAG